MALGRTLKQVLTSVIGTVSVCVSAALGAVILITELTTHATREGHVAIFASSQCLDRAWHGTVTQEIFDNMVNE